ncbi:uncharacterized protein LOC141871312 [Acropora palmata]|uniref:uncharacterized protein LOC141871312 n=1 Tax=Acropora palmata TaxID=6131 RepID=UPI003DA064E9
MDAFGKEALEAHNKFRKAHLSPALVWSSALASDADAWAKKIAREGRLCHDDTSDGENVFMVCGREIDGSDPVNSWYSEVKDYDFSKQGYQTNTGHFSQVVWKGSKQLGIGKAKSADGKVFVVGRYRPAGNMMRAFKENVFPSKNGPVKIPEKKPLKNIYAPAHKNQDESGTTQQTETKVITYPDGTKKTVVSTVTVTLKGNEKEGYTKETKTTVHETKEEDTPTCDTKRALPREAKKEDSFTTDMKKALPRDNAGFEVFKNSPSKEEASYVPSSATKKEFEKQALDAHNKYRTKHKVPPLKWSKEIANEAQAWAEKLAKTRSLQHASASERKGYGENIASFSRRFETAGEEATNMWYSEVKDYRFDKPGFGGNTGHFTQVVWKDSVELGMGRAQTADGRLTFVVARYSPAGNMMNRFQENVFKG